MRNNIHVLKEDKVVVRKAVADVYNVYVTASLIDKPEKDFVAYSLRVYDVTKFPNGEPPVSLSEKDSSFIGRVLFFPTTNSLTIKELTPATDTDNLLIAVTNWIKINKEAINDERYSPSFDDSLYYNGKHYVAE